VRGIFAIFMKPILKNAKKFIDATIKKAEKQTKLQKKICFSAKVDDFC
jgi:hypothetical protein